MEPELEKDRKLIKIFVSFVPKLAGFVWNMRDVKVLRRRHRIIGTFVGCLAKEPRQEHLLGLPLFLMPEEIDLIVAQGIGETFSCDISLRELPSPELKALCQKFCDDRFKSQVTVCSKLRKEDILKRAPKIVEGRLKKLKRSKSDEVTLEKSHQEHCLDDTEISDDEMIKNLVSSAELSSEDASIWSSIIKEEFMRISDVSKNHEILQTFTDHPWLREDQMIPFDWANKSPSIGSLSSLTFEYFWKNNFYLTSGEKFGGSFIAYPGDPCYFHAKYVIVCSSLEEISLMKEKDLVCRSRLGTAVKKSVLLAYLDTNNDVKFKIFRRQNKKIVKRG